MIHGLWVYGKEWRLYIIMNHVEKVVREKLDHKFGINKKKCFFSATQK